MCQVLFGFTNCDCYIIRKVKMIIGAEVKNWLYCQAHCCSLPHGLLLLSSLLLSVDCHTHTHTHTHTRTQNPSFSGPGSTLVSISINFASATMLWKFQFSTLIHSLEISTFSQCLLFFLSLSPDLIRHKQTREDYLCKQNVQFRSKTMKHFSGIGKSSV